MEKTSLKNHKFEKGKFTTPLNEVIAELPDFKSWYYGRLPEYLWLGLIIDKYGRDIGINKIIKILFIFKEHQISDIKFSTILSLETTLKIKILNVIKNEVEDALNPLTLVFTYSNFSDFNKLFLFNEDIEKRKEQLIKVLNESSFHQSDLATDIRYFIVLFKIITNKVYGVSNEEIQLYPKLSHEDEKMRQIRPLIRSMDLAFVNREMTNESFIERFWDEISQITECEELCISSENPNIDINLYLEKVYEIFNYFNSIYKLDPLSEKMNVILGIAVYSYKRFKEIADYKMFDSILARSNVRVLIENYIMLKYLLLTETKQENIWKEYKYYGIGAYKLILTKSREENKDIQNSYINFEYIELLVNEFRNEEFIDMDIRYFDKQNIRQKAEAVGEKDLYNFHYDYGSSYEHGLWGAIRESSMIKCVNPGHRYHTVPDINNFIKLKSTLKDSIKIMNDIIQILKNEFGIPDELLKGVINFEESIDR
ncbi:hypothetical protein HMPREF0202_00962 [Cetobacterium somerae ATCC BAA-474]|uniref:Uncharacterized protein n=1 Tax=Cetobacterium somerae ATCC BAA-474 TaxID=1319815 RepID=U7VDC4_9FUSO|nr:DUF5677 domain-containing protein [Cetobacterium somerae]ERT69129.1 hypothetical protein HMPREF0202_00962 [Cetobacterium somerae ATCC BAA-474]